MADRTRNRSLLLYAITETYAETYWRPAADVYRSRAGWLVKFELAGVRPEDIQVEVALTRIKVSGHRRDCLLEKGCVPYSMEISYNRFERVVELPADLRGAEFESEFHNGMLVVRVLTGGDRL
jgi:HSP20 family protein